MRYRYVPTFVLVCLICLGCQTVTAPRQLAPAAVSVDRFDIRTNPWVSLHFFAFHAARAASGEGYGYRTVSLFPEDAALLDDPAIAADFAPMAKMYAPVLDDRLFRGGLFTIARQLGEGLQTIEDGEVRSTFEAFMPTYREHFWPRHQAMAETFAARLQADMAAQGPALLAVTADELGASWGDSDYITYVSAYTNWAGAFSNDNILFLSAADPDIAAHALEVYVHETAHGEPIGDTIRPAANAALAAHGLEHDRFWHYLQFKATGEAAKRVLGEDYVPYAHATGLTDRGDAKIWYDALDAVWDRYDSLADRAMAAAAFVAAARRAAIPSEQINGPALLITGEADRLGPSTTMAEQLTRRMEAHGFEHTVRHIHYQDAGHNLAGGEQAYGVPNLPPMDRGHAREGTWEGNSVAGVAAWAKVLSFLHSHLK